jgi:hypothetical protein
MKMNKIYISKKMTPKWKKLLNNLAVLFYQEIVN